MCETGGDEEVFSAAPSCPTSFRAFLHRIILHPQLPSTPQACPYMQIGEFYETLGPDAVLLCQHCGLNPMGKRHPPQAGFPIGNIHKTLRNLTDLGFSAVRPLLVQSFHPARWHKQRHPVWTQFLSTSVISRLCGRRGAWRDLLSKQGCAQHQAGKMVHGCMNYS